MSDEGIPLREFLESDEEYCPTSDEGERCGECRHFSLERDGCVHNSIIARVYAEYKNPDVEVKFEPIDDSGTEGEEVQ